MRSRFGRVAVACASVLFTAALSAGPVATAVAQPLSSALAVAHEAVSSDPDVAAVQVLVDGLPTVDGLQSMSENDRQAAYDQVIEAYDAFEALDARQHGQVVGTEVFDSLFAVFNGMANLLADTGGFNVSGADSGYSYEKGVLTISTSAPLTISTNGQTADRIVIASGATANLTLSNVNINAPANTSAIDVSSGASLTLTLANGSQNTLTTASTSNANSYSGIHVPENASLTIQCANTLSNNHQCNDDCGKLSVKGSEGPNNGYGGAGIGGNGSANSTENSGTIRILGGQVTINGGTSAYGGAGIGGGAGASGGDCGAVYITGGQVTITGGTSNGSSTGVGGAGIGGGIGTGGNGGDGGTVVITGGNVEVIGGSGGSSTGSRGGAGIGGGNGNTVMGLIDGNGGDGGTVVILTTEVTVTGGSGNSVSGVAIGGGTASNGGSSGDEGGGIKPDSNGNYTVYGSPTLPNPPDTYTIPAGAALTIPSGSTLIVPSGTELVVDGTLKVETGGSLSNSGTVSGGGELTGEGSVSNSGSITVSNNDFAVSVSLSIATGNPMTPVSYGSLVTLAASVTESDDQPVNGGTVTFYQGEASNENALNSIPVAVSNGSATYELTLSGDGWKPSETAYTIIAVYTPASGSGLLSGSGSAALTMSKATPTAPSAPSSAVSISANSVTLATVGGDDAYGAIEYGYKTGADAEPSHWQGSATFNSLSPATTYTFYTRYAGNDFYSASSASNTGLSVITPPDISTDNLTGGSVGATYGQQLKSSATDVAWSVASGSLPNGLTLSADGVISGAPTAVGDYTFTVQASVTVDGTTVNGTKELSISIAKGMTGITVTSDPVTATYGDTMAVSGTTSNIPAGATLILGDGDGLATGTVGSDGNFTISYGTGGKGIQATGGSQTISVSYAGDNDRIAASASVSVTLNKKSVTAQVQGQVTKVYDGDANAMVSLAVATSDLVNGGDQVTVTGTGTYQSTEVGTNIPVTVDNIQIGGTDKDWYSVSAPTDVTGSITQSGSSLSATAASRNLTYGDTLTITVTPTYTGQAPADNALSALDAGDDTVELYKGDSLLAGTSTKNSDGAYTLTYKTTDKGLSIGENTLTVKFRGDNNMAASETTVKVSLSAKQATASVAGTPTKTYDGGAEIKKIGLTVVDGLEGNDSFSGTIDGSFDNANVGTGKTITLDDETLQWTDDSAAGFYAIALPGATTGDITAADFTGSASIAPSGVVRFGDTLTANYTGDYTGRVTYTWQRDGEGDAISTGAAYTLTADDIGHALTVTVAPDSDNYTGSVTSEATATVQKAIGTITITSDPSKVYDGEPADDPSVETSNTGADVTYTYEGVGGTSYGPSETAPTDAGIYAVTVSVEQTATHAAATSEPVTFSIAKAASAVTAPPAAVSGLIYTGEPQALVTAGEADGGVMVYSLDGEAYSTDVPAATDAGFHTVWYKVSGDGNHEDSESFSIEATIAKARPEVTLTASPKSLFGGGRVTLALAGLPDGAEAAVTCDGGIDVAMSDDGTWRAYLPNTSREYTFTATVAEAGNFEAAEASCTVKVSYSATAAPTYPPTVDAGEGGSVDVSPSRPQKGQTVTIAPAPDEGQEVRDVTVTDADGNPVEVAENGDGTWSFTQPEMKVTVEVAFGCDGGDLCASRAFADVDASAWYHDPIDWAVENGVMSGYSGSGLMGPDDALTREQAAAVLMRWAAMRGEDTSARADLSAYPDAGDVSPWARDCMGWAVAAGVVSGVDGPGGTKSLDPSGTATRAQAAALMMRLLEGGE